jgi:hypothetical protein
MKSLRHRAQTDFMDLARRIFGRLARKGHAELLGVLVLCDSAILMLKVERVLGTSTALHLEMAVDTPIIALALLSTIAALFLSATD